MRKLLRLKLLVCLLALIAPPIAIAQGTSDYQKKELYIGYSNEQVDAGFDSGNSISSFFRNRVSFNGFEAAGVYNLHRYFGIKADVSGTYFSQRSAFLITTGTSTQVVSFDLKDSVYNIVGGIQVKDNANTGRLKPFVHALIGISNRRTSTSNFTCTTVFASCSGSSASQTGLSGIFGGGLDIRLNHRIDLRAFQIDYNPMEFNNYSTDNNIRFGIGIVIK